MDQIGSLQVSWIQGFTNNNIEFVDTKTVCYTCGNHICFLNLETNKRRVFRSPGRGIGALTANGNSRIFAFSEQKLSPSMFVYIFPELQLKNELKGKTQLDYTSMTLSNSGPFLGCCSSLPNYTITVWNWESAEPLCSQPHAGQDVTSLLFNPLNWLQLCALGTTSLTVWNIEKSGSFHVLKPSVIEFPKAEVFPQKGTSFSGLKEDMLPSSTTKPSRNARLTPSAICWTATSQLYVGCVEGFLLLVDPERLSVSVLLNPKSTYTVPELRNGNFQGLTLHKIGLIAVGKESVMHCLQIKGSQIDIAQTWQLEKPVTSVKYCPDNETLLLFSDTGQIYTLNQNQSEEIVKVLDVLSGNFVTAAFLQTDMNICVSLRNSGELQLWSSDGTVLGSLSLQTEVTSLACCPIAHYAAVGTASGNVLFIDLNTEQQPRLVHQVNLYHAAVDHLIFDQEGHFLFTSASDSHIYVLDAKPSKMFSVIGYTVIPGRILSLSSWYIRDCKEVRVLALYTEQEDKHQDGSLLTVFSLPTRTLSVPDCVDRHGCLSTEVLKVFRYEVPNPLTSCVLGIGEIFAYCHRQKTLQQFHLPKSTNEHYSEKTIRLKLRKEVKANQLSPASLLLSPHRLWLASVDREGLLRVRKTASIEQYIELQCHSYRLGGIRSVSFSADSHKLLTAGFNDGALICADLRFQGEDTSEMTDATEYSQSLAHCLKGKFNTENPILTALPVWGQGSPASTEKPEESEVSAGTSVDVREQDERAPPSNPIWLESKQEEVIKEDNEQNSEIKKNLREMIQDLRDTFQEMLSEYGELPEQHYYLDVEEQRRVEAMAEEEVETVRSEIERDIVEKSYRRDILTRECWDSLKVKGRAIKAFHSNLEVKNYPLKERTHKELEDLRRVQNIRTIEKAVCSQRNLNESFSAQEEDHGDEGHVDQTPAMTGSFTAQLGYSDPYIYDQFSLQTIEQRINQIILLQDVIYRIKTAFNAEFEALHTQKVQELKRVSDRNKHIRVIKLELDVTEELDVTGELWEPDLTDSEWPERLFTVDDSEIKAEKYLTPEQKKEEELRQLEKQNRLAAESDDYRKKALDDMMDGVLEVKKEDILKMEIPPPDFVLTKSNVHWSEEEKKIYKEYEKKAKDLSEEKEKYKKSLEMEIKKLRESIKDATKTFDESLIKLLENKLKFTVALHQEELKICYLVESVHEEEEMRNREKKLKHQLEKMLACKEETEEELKGREEEVELFHEAYDSIVVEDKRLDREFRTEFLDIPSQMIDYLYKLFKRRPRVQKMRTQTDTTSKLSRERSQAFDGPNKMLKAMDELDASENMPTGLNSSIWERFCLFRRTKVESEQKVKLKALTLAEMQAFLQKRRDENKAAQQEIKNLSDALESLHNERNHLLKNIMVQVILQQGQVEVSTRGLTLDYTDIILYHRTVVDDIRSSIRNRAEQKIAYMVKCKDVHSSMIQLEWEQKVLMKQIEDLNEKARGIKMLRISKEEQDMTHLNKKNKISHMAKQVSFLEKSNALMEKTHQQSVQRRIKKIERINKQAAMKAKQTANLYKQLPDLQVTVAELRHIWIETVAQENEVAKREERYQEIVERRNLEDITKRQRFELDFLWAEVERLRMKNFPSLDKLAHN